MKIVLLMLSMLPFWGSIVFAQNNLVLNPGFEEYTSCPTGNDQINRAKYWSSIDSLVTYKTGYDCYPDLCHRCVVFATDSFNSIPRSTNYWQYPRTGDGMMQFGAYYYDVKPGGWGGRQYVQGRLRNKLVAGKQYCVSFFVNLEDCSGFSVKEISAYLDNGAIDTASKCDWPQTQYTPQVKNTGGFLSDTMGWMKIEGSFIAKGTESFITIGNFNDDAHTTVMPAPYNPSFYFGIGHGIYLLDDVSVIPSDLPADAGPDTHVGKGDSVYIGRPKEVGPECSWSVLGSSSVIGKGVGIWVKPSVTTSYVVTQTLCGVTKKDTVRVEVWAAGVHSVNGQRQEYTFAPNPVPDQMQLLQGVPDEKLVVMSLYDATGRLVVNRNLSFKESRAGVDVLDLSSGFYYLKLNDAYGNVYSLKVVKE